MLDRRWMQYAPLVGVVIVILVSGFIALQHERNPANIGQEASANQAATAPNAASANSESGKSGDKQAAATENHQPCDNPDDCVERDLIAQQQMAVATDRMADIAERQLRATNIEIGLLVATVLAALVAVGAALCANRIARKSAEAQLRAYVNITSAEIVGTKEQCPNFRIHLKNTGVTPAYAPLHSHNTLVCPPGEERFIYDQGGFKPLPVLGPGRGIMRTTILSKLDWMLIKNQIAKGDLVFYVFGEVVYRDAFDRRQTTYYRYTLFIDDEGITDGELAVCDDGNDAT